MPRGARESQETSLKDFRRPCLMLSIGWAFEDVWPKSGLGVVPEVLHVIAVVSTTGV